MNSQMTIGTPQLLLDLYEWLPSDGESKMSFRSTGPDVVVEIEYEKEFPSPNGGDDVAIYRREIVFKFARYFIKTPFPGAALFKFDQNSKKPTIGGLTEFLDSEFAKSCADTYHTAYGGKIPKMRHFSIQFLSAKIGFHILAEDVFLSDELLLE